MSDKVELSFDVYLIETFNEIKDLKPIIYLKLFSDENVVQQITPVLFPEKYVLVLIKEYFEKKVNSIYKKIVDLLDSVLM